MPVQSNSSLFTSASAVFWNPRCFWPGDGLLTVWGTDSDVLSGQHHAASEMIILHLWTALPQCCISASNLMLLIKKENRIKATIPARQWEMHSVDLHVSHLVPSFTSCTGVSPAIDILYNTFCIHASDIMSQVLKACFSVCSQRSRHTLI